MEQGLRLRAGKGDLMSRFPWRLTIFENDFISKWRKETESRLPRLKSCKRKRAPKDSIYISNLV